MRETESLLRAMAAGWLLMPQWIETQYAYMGSIIGLRGLLMMPKKRRNKGRHFTERGMGRKGWREVMVGIQLIYIAIMYNVVKE